MTNTAAISPTAQDLADVALEAAREAQVATDARRKADRAVRVALEALDVARGAALAARMKESAAWKAADEAEAVASRAGK